MRRLSRYTTRFALLIALLTPLSLLLGPTTHGSGPYQSALQDLTLGASALAAHCPNSGCILIFPPPANCGFKAGYKCHMNNKTCSQAVC